MGRALTSGEVHVIERLLALDASEGQAARAQIPFLLVQDEILEPDLSLEFVCELGAPSLGVSEIGGPIVTGYARYADGGIVELVLFVDENGHLCTLELISHGDRPATELPPAASITGEYLDDDTASGGG